MDLLNLADIIIKKTGIGRAGAVASAWRILNEYQEDFRTAAFDLAQGKEPTVRVRGMTLKDVEKISGARSFEALELLRIISMDGDSGMELVFRLGRSDRILR